MPRYSGVQECENSLNSGQFRSISVLYHKHMKLRPTSFSSKTTPWRVVLPARLSPDRKRKTKYFALKQDALTFCKKVNDGGIAALADHAPIPKTEHDQMETAIRWALNELGGDFTRLYDAVDHFKLTRLNIKRATVREAFEAYD